MSQPDPRSLLVLAFDSAMKAREALLAMQRLQVEGIVLLHDAVFIDKDVDGTTNVTETVDTPPAESAVSGGLWGALFGTLLAGPVGTLLGGAVTAGFGAIAAKLIDIGIPDATVKEMEEAVAPGTTALALLLSHVREDALAQELARFAGAKLVRSTLTPEAVSRLRDALHPAG